MHGLCCQESEIDPSSVVSARRHSYGVLENAASACIAGARENFRSPMLKTIKKFCVFGVPTLMLGKHLCLPV
jgi:hypothetical protein